MHTHIHTCINAYIYIYIHTCTYTYICMSAHIHTYTYIHTYTHTYKLYICTHASTSETTARQRLRGKPNCTSRSSALLPVRCNPEEDYPSWPAAQLPVHEEQQISAEQPQSTAAQYTITTARRPDRIRLSALVRSRSTQCQLGCGPPKRGHCNVLLCVAMSYDCLLYVVCLCNITKIKNCFL